MSRLAASEIDSLQVVAHEILETWGAHGHHVGVALGVNPDFTETENPRSALARAIVVKAYERGARKACIGHENGPGGSRELHTFNGSVEHLFRLLKANIDADGEYFITVKDDGMLRGLEITLLGRQERWVFAYTLVGDHLGELFVAEVLGVLAGNPGRLILGPRVHLDGAGTGPVGGVFTPADEDLDLGDDDLGERGYEEPDTGTD